MAVFCIVRCVSLQIRVLRRQAQHSMNLLRYYLTYFVLVWTYDGLYAENKYTAFAIWSVPILQWPSSVRKSYTAAETLFSGSDCNMCAGSPYPGSMLIQCGLLSALANQDK